MKKQLNVDLIQNELRGGSAFFPGYKGSDSSIPPTPTPLTQESTTIPKSKPSVRENSAQAPSVGKPEKLSNKTSSIQGVPPPVPRTVPRTEPRTTPLIPKVKRLMKQRQPFDIYEDQYARLKQIADTERGFENGRSMSQMVREAIDAYLKDHGSQK
jgi:hypothetical protein